MDFLDPAKKRAHLTRLYIGYALIGVVVLLGAYLFMSVLNGFWLNKSGQVVQNGLLFVDSQPGGAVVSIDSQNGKFHREATTDTRQTIPEGTYKIHLAKQGYRSWQKTVEVVGNSVERVVYPMLFPENMTTTNRRTYTAAPGFSTQTPDRQWIIIQKPGSLIDFEMIDANDPQKASTTITIPEAVLSKGTTSSYKLVEWSTDNRHVLLQHTYDGKIEFIMLDREDPASTANINKLLNVEPTKIALRDKKFDKLYLHTATGGVLQFADTSTKQITSLLNNVLVFRPHGSDKILYVSGGVADASKVMVKIRIADKTYDLRALPANTQYLLDLAQYNGHWEYVVGAQNENQVYIYRDPIDVLSQPNSKTAIIARTLRISSPTRVSFSGTARFMAVQGGKNFVVYDGEKDRQYRFTVSQPLNTDNPMEWMDGHRLVGVADDKTLVVEYDGQNVQSLVAQNPGTLPFFDRDYQSLYTLDSGLGANKDQTALLYAPLETKE